MPIGRRLEKKIEHTVRKYDPEFKLADVFSSDNQYYKILCDKLRKGLSINRNLSFLFFYFGPMTILSTTAASHRRTFMNTVVHLLKAGWMAKEFKEKLEVISDTTSRANFALYG